jgi:hypothetical protein
MLGASSPRSWDGPIACSILVQDERVPALADAVAVLEGLIFESNL